MSFHAISLLLVSIIMPMTIALEIEALGRVAQLGQIYDARSEDLLPFSIVKNGLPATSLHTTQNEKSSWNLEADDTLASKSSKLSLSLEGKLTLFTGVLALKGAVKFLQESRTSAQCIRATAVFSATTAYQQVNFNVVGKSSIDQDMLANANATHVIVGIQYGGNAFVSLEQNINETDVESDVKSSLQMELKSMIYGIGVGVGSHQSMSRSDRSKWLSYKFSMISDFMPDYLSLTYDETLSLIRHSPLYLKQANNGKGQQVSYTLLPLEDLRRIWNTEAKVKVTLKPIESAIVTRCVHLFDRITKVQQQLSDVIDDVEEYGRNLKEENVRQMNNMKYDFEKFQARCKEDVKNHLVRVRSGTDPVNKLLAVLRKTEKDPMLNRLDQDDVKSIKDELKFIKDLTKMNVQVLGRDDTFDSFLSQNQGKTIMVIFYRYRKSIASDDNYKFFTQKVQSIDEKRFDILLVAVNMDIVEVPDRRMRRRLSKVSLYRDGRESADLNEIAEYVDKLGKPLKQRIDKMIKKANELVEKAPSLFIQYIG